MGDMAQGIKDDLWLLIETLMFLEPDLRVHVTEEVKRAIEGRAFSRRKGRWLETTNPPHYKYKYKANPDRLLIKRVGAKILKGVKSDTLRKKLRIVVNKRGLTIVYNNDFPILKLRNGIVETVTSEDTISFDVLFNTLGSFEAANNHLGDRFLNNKTTEFMSRRKEVRVKFMNNHEIAEMFSRLEIIERLCLQGSYNRES